MGNPLTSSKFQRLLDNRLTEVSVNSFDALPSKIESLYRVFPSDKAFDEFYDVGSVPNIPEFNGKLSYATINPGFHKKIEPKEFAGGLEFERKLLDDERYGVFDNRAEMLAIAAKRTREDYGVRQFANAFSTAFDFMTSEEGISLCGSHLTKSGVSTTTGLVIQEHQPCQRQVLLLLGFL